MKYPLITIIIPVGSGYPFDVVLKSIKKVDYPVDKIEVLVVEGKQPAKQRNEAIKIAKGEIIFFFDDDVIVKKDIIKRMLKYFDDKLVAVVGGPNLTPPSDNFLQKCFGYVMGSFLGAAQMSNRYKASGKVREATEKDLILCNLSGKTDILKKNLFNEKLWPNEENELFNRLRKQRFKLIYDPSAIVYHSRRPTIKKFIKQNFGYGRGRAEQIIIQPTYIEPLFLFPTLFTIYFVTLIFLISFFIIPLNYKIILFLPIIIYSLVTILFSFISAYTNKNILSFFILPFIFPLVHIPYGLGMLYGFINNVFFKKTFNKKIKIQNIKIEIS